MIILGFLVSHWKDLSIYRNFRTWLKPSHLPSSTERLSSYPLSNLVLINPIYHLLILTITTVITYSILWIPYLIMNPEDNFWDMQYKILSYHESIKTGSDVHPYCSTWYSWILMLRPIAYYYEKSHEVIHDVHSMANPLLLWLSSLAIFSIFIWLIFSFLRSNEKKAFFTPVNWLLSFFIINYLANLLPWSKVTRCIFFYHYLESYTFAILALAWIINGWLNSPQYLSKFVGISSLLVIIIAFIYWLPIYLGMPLSQDNFDMRIFDIKVLNWI